MIENVWPNCSFEEAVSYIAIFTFKGQNCAPHLMVQNVDHQEIVIKQFSQGKLKLKENGLLTFEDKKM